MEQKAKTKSVRKTTKKSQSASVGRIQVEYNQPNRFNQSILLIRKKRVVVGIGFAIVLIISLLFIFKSLFIVAIVNGEPVSRLSVVKELEKQGGKAILDRLITKKLILQEAKERNVAISQNDIDQELKKIAASLESQGTTIDQTLASQGMSRDQLVDELKIQLIVQRMVEKNVTITDKEIDEFIATNKNQLQEGITEDKLRQQSIEQIKQQKLQGKTQEFIKSLLDKAKIINFVQY